MKVYDISPCVSSSTIVYPGDPSFHFSYLETIKENSWNLSSISLSSHTGSHFDSPFHVFNEGKKVDEIPVARFFGSLLLLDFSSQNMASHSSFPKVLQAVHLKKVLDEFPDSASSFSLEKIKFLGVKTNNSMYLDQYESVLQRSSSKDKSDKEASFSLEELVELSLSFVQAVCDNSFFPSLEGIVMDGLSVGSLDVHKYLLSRSFLVFENVRFSGIPAGLYYFIGLPLKVNLEGAPARCILLDKSFF